MLEMITLKMIARIINIDAAKVYGFASTNSYLIDDGENMLQVFEVKGLENAHGWAYGSNMLVFQDCGNGYFKEPFAQVERDREFWAKIKADVEIDAKTFVGNLENDSFVEATMDENFNVTIAVTKEVQVNTYDDMVLELRGTCAYEPWATMGISALDLINGKIGDEFKPDIEHYNCRAVDEKKVTIVEKFGNTVTVLVEHYTTTDSDNPEPMVEEQLIKFIIVDLDGSFDEIGGFHSGGTGTDPNGHECGECSNESCKNWTRNS